MSLGKLVSGTKKGGSPKPMDPVKKKGARNRALKIGGALKSPKI